MKPLLACTLVPVTCQFAHWSPQSSDLHGEWVHCALECLLWGNYCWVYHLSRIMGNWITDTPNYKGYSRTKTSGDTGGVVQACPWWLAFSFLWSKILIWSRSGDLCKVIPRQGTISMAQDAGNMEKCIKLGYQLAIASPACKLATVALMH